MLDMVFSMNSINVVKKSTIKLVHDAMEFTEEILESSVKWTPTLPMI